MLAEERRAYIKNLLERFNSVDISSLSKEIGVSVSTIRRDLDKLAKNKDIKRTRGGALSTKLIKSELNFNIKKEVNIREKKLIGLVAAKYVNNGDTIFIESGSTAVQMCLALGKVKELTVVTNSCDIAAALNSVNPETNIIITGGIMKLNTHSLIGPLADRAIKDFKFQKAFIGITGIDINSGITTVDFLEANTKRAIIDSSLAIYGLADFDKFGKVCLNFVCPITRVNTIITDNKTDRKYIDEISKMGIEVIVCD